MTKYLNKLSNEDITIFLDNNNYALVSHLKDQHGQAFPAIERSDERIFVRCKKKEIPEQQLIDTEVAYYLMKKHPGFMSLSMMLSSQYGSDIEMLVFSDFEVSKLCIFDDDVEEYISLNKAYAKFMNEKFPNSSYMDDYYDWLQQDEEELSNEL